MGQLSRAPSPRPRTDVTVLLLAAWLLWVGNGFRLAAVRIVDPDSTTDVRRVLYAEASPRPGAVTVEARGRARSWSLLAVEERAWFVDELRLVSTGAHADAGSALEVEVQVRTARDDATLSLEDEGQGASLFAPRDPDPGRRRSPALLRLERFRPRVLLRLPLGSGPATWLLRSRSVDLSIQACRVVPAAELAGAEVPSLEDRVMDLSDDPRVRVEADGQCSHPYGREPPAFLLGDAALRFVAVEGVRLRFELRGPEPASLQPRVEVLAGADPGGALPGRLAEVADGVWHLELALAAGRELELLLRFPSAPTSHLATHFGPNATQFTAWFQAIDVESLGTGPR